jgi:hypothetical protein
MNMIQRAQAMIAGFIGVTISALFWIFISVTSHIALSIFAWNALSGSITHPRRTRQKRTKAERNIPMLQANRFCTEPTQISSHFERNGRTIEPKILHFGERITFRRKSVTIRLTKRRGIWYSALKRTRKSEKSQSTSDIPVAIRISRSSTNP